MKKIFACLSIVVTFFLSSFSVAQNVRPECGIVTKYYPVFMACVDGVSTRPIFYTIEISTLMTPYSCAPIYYSRDANVTVTDQSGAILRTMIIKQSSYTYNIKPTGSYFLSFTYNLNLFNCLVDKGYGQGGFSVGN